MLRKIFQFIAWTAIVLVLAIIALFTFLEIKTQNGIEELNNSDYVTHVDPLPIMDTTQQLTITPLIDWHTDREDLKTEMGVSYLIETDSVNILFDVGYNAKQDSISPLQHNMNKLGITPADYDIVYITHNHLDHVGGKSFMDSKTFGINPTQSTDLQNHEIYTPIEMSYPEGDPQVTQEPFRIAPGVASIGTMPRQLFLGRIQEQSMAINVAGKGLVLLVGCAHQGIPKIIERTQALFDEPIYGIVGGLHLPVPKGRMKMAGIHMQVLQSGNGMFDPISEEDVERYFDLFDQLDMQLISIGGHDSSDEMIEKAKERFGERYVELEVGERIKLN